MLDLSPGTILTGFVVSTIGFSVLLYGKKQGRVPQLVFGGLMMVSPLLLRDPWLLAGCNALLVGALWLVLRRDR